MASLNCGLLSVSPVTVTPRRKIATSVRRAGASVRITAAVQKERSYKVTLLPGDGIGPEIMRVAVDFLRSVGGREGEEMMDCLSRVKSLKPACVDVGIKFDFTQKLGVNRSSRGYWRPHDNRVQFRMHRFRCAAAKPVQAEESSKNEPINDEEEDDYPMFMEEDDPTWPEGEDDGYGFQVSQLFEKWGNPTVKNVNDNGKIVEEEEEESDDEGDGDDKDLSLKWEEEEYLWIVREINFLEWDIIALQDPTPLIVLGFERYGSSGQNGWALLKELETMVKKILHSRKYPVRAVKFDVNIEPDLAAALKIKAVPTLLFINAGKLVYRMTGLRSADELLQITSHLFYHSTRPSCMDDDKTSEAVANMR